MKNLIVILMFLFCGLSSIFANDSFNCYAITAKGNDCEWDNWRMCDIDGVYDYQNKTIFIYSSDIQIFKYQKITREVIDNKIIYHGEVTDLQGEKAYMTIIISFDGLRIIHFKYPKGEYMYLVNKLPIN